MGAEGEPGRLRVGFLGPLGTFTEMALLTQPDLAGSELVPIESIPDVLQATADGVVDVGFVPVENAIEGTVNLAMDSLAFELDLLIQREVVIDVLLHLLAPAGVKLDAIERVMSIPPAITQVRGFLRSQLPDAVIVAANSTAEAAQLVAKHRWPDTAAVGTALAAELYGLELLVEDIADHEGNQTRFVLVGREGVPPPSGHDKTSLVVYQRADAPGSLLAILQEFAARRINLVKLESRPTRQGLGHYCFLIDLEGHISDEVVGDCLVNIKAKQDAVKFLGSYPAAGEHEETRARVDSAQRQAAEWMDGLRGQIS